jgi:hypothetical protein
MMRKGSGPEVIGIEGSAERMLVIDACVCTSELFLIGPDFFGMDPLNCFCTAPDSAGAEVVG